LLLSEHQLLQKSHQKSLSVVSTRQQDQLHQDCKATSNGNTKSSQGIQHQQQQQMDKFVSEASKLNQVYHDSRKRGHQMLSSAVSLPFLALPDEGIQDNKLGNQSISRDRDQNGHREVDHKMQINNHYSSYSSLPTSHIPYPPPHLSPQSFSLFPPQKSRLPIIKKNRMFNNNHPHHTSLMHLGSSTDALHQIERHPLNKAHFNMTVESREQLQHRVNELKQQVRTFMRHETLWRERIDRLKLSYGREKDFNFTQTLSFLLHHKNPSPSSLFSFSSV